MGRLSCIIRWPGEYFGSLLQGAVTMAAHVLEMLLAC